MILRLPLSFLSKQIGNLHVERLFGALDFAWQAEPAGADAEGHAAVQPARSEGRNMVGNGYPILRQGT